MTDEWTLAAAHDALAAAVPDRDMIVWGDDRRTFAQVADRTKRLAGYLAASGLGVRRERSDLERLACVQSPVALIMCNRPEFLFSMLCSFLALAFPFHLNPPYHPPYIPSLLPSFFPFSFFF